MGNPSFLNRFEVGNVYGKEYTLENLPSEEELESDLNEMLDVYTKLKKKIPKEQLISFVSNNPKLKDNIETSEDKTKFKLKTNNHCNFFIKLLDDDFLKSELTQEEYEALAKNNV